MTLKLNALKRPAANAFEHLERMPCKAQRTAEACGTTADDVGGPEQQLHPDADADDFFAEAHDFVAMVETEANMRVL